MRKTTLFFWATCFIVALLLSGGSLSAKISKASTAIVLRKLPHGTEHHDEAPRSLIIEAYYDSELSYVSASLSSAGTFVDVYIENQDTEEQYNYQIPGTGNSVLPISGTSGYWTITFILSNGDEYVGYFIL